MSSLAPDFAKGASGSADVYDTTVSGLGMSPAYLAQGASASASGFSGTLPSGSILAYGGSTAPAGYVLCDGSTYDGTSTTYANLWAALGVLYGGSGQSAFKVPDMQGRVAVMKGSNAAVSTLGNSDGVAVANRRPKHRHTAHTHTSSLPTHYAGSLSITGFYPGTSDNLITENSAPTTTPSATTSSSVDGGSGTATDSLDAPAYLVVNYIIAL